MLGMSISELCKYLRKDDYKLYPKFNECIQKFKKSYNQNLNDSYIYVCFILKNNLDSYEDCLKYTNYHNRYEEIFNSMKDDLFPVSKIFFNCRNIDGNPDFFTITKGCLIVVNYESILNKNSIDYFEKILDHEFNHYFSILNKRVKNVKTTKLKSIFKSTKR